MRFEGIGEVVNVDHHLLYAGDPQLLENVVEQRLAADLDQGFRPGRSQGSHPFPQPCRHEWKIGFDSAESIAAEM